MKIQTSSFTGNVIAFVRPQSVVTPSFESIQEAHTLSFTNKLALVIGGSRGLGAVTTKLLASTGADVLFTYYECEEEANEIVNDCCKWGANVTTQQLDVMHPEILSGDINPDMFFYFATPYIFEGTLGEYSKALFEKFNSYYVSAYLNLVMQYCTKPRMDIFYPSSVAIDEKVSDMQEYIDAKIAGEICCEQLKLNHPEWTILTPRLPRIQSDQTVSILPTNDMCPLTLMLEQLVRFMN